jgi:diguanylate cyclase (GGDEF)-like protein
MPSLASSALLLIDLDQFMLYNDTHGHHEGDAMLKLVAGAVRQCSEEPANCCRWAGEEFLVLLRDVTLEQAMAHAEMLRRQVEETTVRRMTVSIGVAEGGSTQSFDIILQRADAAVYAAKRRGRNQVATWDDECESWLVESDRQQRINKAALQLQRELDLPVFRSFTRDGMPNSSAHQGDEQICWETSRLLLGSAADTAARIRERMPQQHDIDGVRCVLLTVENRLLLCWCWQLSQRLATADELASRFKTILASLSIDGKPIDDRP